LVRESVVVEELIVRLEGRRFRCLPLVINRRVVFEMSLLVSGHLFAKLRTKVGGYMPTFIHLNVVATISTAEV
jgi:hypothetical protein